jgi:lauroyl/myristoyl acyltransferase
MIEKERVEEIRENLKLSFPYESDKSIEDMLNTCVNLAEFGGAEDE